MAKYYSDEKNVQVLVALLKAHGIRKVVASPGSTNIPLVGSLQNDPFFQIYSSVDERSAAYIACGLADESQEPVMISCTGATASRNYLSGLTEAFYRKLPILAVTATQVVSKTGHHIAQVIDRSSMQKDVAKLSVNLPIIKDEHDLWECEVKINNAILELKRYGGGPVHINNPTMYVPSFNTKKLPSVRVIDRITSERIFPELPSGKVAIFIGTHKKMSEEETVVIDEFCSVNDAVVLCDHTSSYKGKYRSLFSLVACQKMFDKSIFQPQVLIHIGEISGDYYTPGLSAKEVWRISEDGEIRDTFRKLRYVFEMHEKNFFKFYSQNKHYRNDEYFKQCDDKYREIYNKIPELPFSNAWIASKMARRIPEGATVHFGILNSLRMWNFFELPFTVSSSSNVGGFGIDGNVSSLVGASFVDKHKLYFGIIGDLAFFYDLNVIGNRHVGKNLRILLVNNGKGTEFKHYTNPGSQFGDDADKYIAAGQHFGNQSPKLVKNFVEDLGFDYYTASNKEEFENIYEKFLIPELANKSIVFEVMIDSNDESDAFDMIRSIEENMKGRAKILAKQVLNDKSLDVLRKVMKN